MAGGTQSDGLDAVSKIAELLKPLAPEVQRRVLRWAQELAGLTPESPLAAHSSAGAAHQQAGAATGTGGSRDIRSFIKAKDPKSDQQFAAAVAYFYAFEAPEADRKIEISATDLQEGARLSDSPRLKDPNATLNNALRSGYLDRAQRGTFRINAVGENLVAMTMPGGNAGGEVKPRKKRKERKQRVRKARR